MHQVQVNCSVCGDQRHKEFLQVTRQANDGSEGSYRIARCTVYGFLYANPRPSLDELAALYRRHAAFFREDYEPVSRELPVLRQALRDIRRFVRAGSS